MFKEMFISQLQMELHAEPTREASIILHKQL